MPSARCLLRSAMGCTSMAQLAIQLPSATIAASPVSAAVAFGTLWRSSTASAATSDPAPHRASTTETGFSQLGAPPDTTCSPAKKAPTATKKAISRQGRSLIRRATRRVGKIWSAATM